MLAREIRSLIKIGLAVETGQSIDSVMRSQRVMSKRTSLVGRCVKAHRVADFELMIQDLSRVDKMIKGIGQGDPWDEITGLILNLSGRKLASWLPWTAFVCGLILIRKGIAFCRWHFVAFLAILSSSLIPTPSVSANPAWESGEVSCPGCCLFIKLPRGIFCVLCRQNIRKRY